MIRMDFYKQVRIRFLASYLALPFVSPFDAPLYHTILNKFLAQIHLRNYRPVGADFL
jgi:hypothetical protein